MANITRVTALKRMLNQRRRELRQEVDARIRDSRDGRPRDVRDAGEDSDAEHHGDLEFSLLQMQTDTLRRIDEALLRVDAGQYGTCVACRREIAAPRLRALPFAVRCTTCEDKREQAQERASRLAKNGGFTLVPDSVGA